MEYCGIVAAVCGKGEERKKWLSERRVDYNISPAAFDGRWRLQLGAI